MKIFMTGASGFLGRALVRRLQEDQAVERIYCLYRKSPANLQAKVAEIHGDLAALDALDSQSPVDVCIHCAALLEGRGVSRESIFSVNVDGTKRVIGFCRKHHIPRIIYISSINVLLQQGGAYAESKRQAEQAIRESGLSYMIFRPALIFGPGCAGVQKVLNYMKRCPLVPVFGDGEKLEQPVYIDELTAILHHYLHHFSPGATLPLCGKEAVPYNAFMSMLGHLLGRRIFLMHFPASPARLAAEFLEACHVPVGISPEQIAHMDEDLAGDMTEIYAETGVKPCSLQENLRKYLHAIGESGTGGRVK